jgi:hypothetical protein
MRKIMALLTALLLTLSVTLTASADSVPDWGGGSCGTLNKVVSLHGYKFTCIKKNGTLTWSFPVFSLAVDKNYQKSSTAITFQNLNQNLHGIIYESWLHASQQIQNSTSTLGNVQLLVGPNTKIDQTPAMMAKVSRLYANFAQVKNLYLIEFSPSDTAWAQQRYDQLHPNNYNPNAAAGECSAGVCKGEQAGINANGDGVILAGQDGSLDPRNSTGSTLAHEYTHTVQMTQATCRDNEGCYGSLPDWLLEGNAEWSSLVATESTSYPTYAQFRYVDTWMNYSTPSQFTANWISTYLNPTWTVVAGQDQWAYWQKYPFWDMYSFGLMANEVLAAIKGPDAIMNMYKDVGSGMTFQQAFQQEFGMAWSEACPLIATAISTEIQKGIEY